jgi:glycosyltransferase involved in cell wall biosynthesis
VRICVLGTHSFVGDGPKIGTQHIAETLAAFGHEVTYVTSPASLPAALLPSQRHRFLAARGPSQVRPRLTEVTPLALLPSRVLKQAERLGLGGVLAAANARVERTRHGVVEREAFDVCVFSAAASLTLVRRIRARRYVYRVNDLLARLRGVPRSLLAEERRLLRDRVDAVWAVNDELAAHVRRIGSPARVSVIPNGVDLQLFDSAVPDPELAPTRERNVIYVGALEFWVDVPLLMSAARLLPDHAFHVYGPWAVPVPSVLPPNVAVHGPIAHSAIAAKMKACAVGVMPTAPINRGRLVEKPIKFYEYLAAGLGVAATTHAGERLVPYAAIGDTPEAFANAIRAARWIPGRHGDEMRAEVCGRDWPRLVRAMLADLSPEPEPVAAS